jgi:hypothetical protein
MLFRFSKTMNKGTGGADVFYFPPYASLWGYDHGRPIHGGSGVRTPVVQIHHVCLSCDVPLQPSSMIGTGRKKDELVKRDAVLVSGKINAGNMPECFN